MEIFRRISASINLEIKANALHTVNLRTKFECRIPKIDKNVLQDFT